MQSSAFPAEAAPIKSGEGSAVAPGGRDGLAWEWTPVAPSLPLQGREYD